MGGTMATPGRKCIATMMQQACDDSSQPVSSTATVIGVAIRTYAGADAGPTDTTCRSFVSDSGQAALAGALSEVISQYPRCNPVETAA